ncbi:MAG: DUF493 family protein [Flavobacteriaceae bacterium]|nr:DUF493 family protein [Flavobacteriaceae bacterium]
MSTPKEEAFYKDLKEKLNNTTTWPSKYLYKFIVPTDVEKINTIQGHFGNMGAVIQTKKSKKGTYTSVSILVQMKNADQIIEKYKLVTKIDGVISL